MSPRQKRTPIDVFCDSMRYIARCHDCTISVFQRKGAEAGNNFDDGMSSIYTPKGKAAQELKKRVLDRMAELFCYCDTWKDGAIVMMRENEQLNSSELWVIPFRPSGTKTDSESPAFLAEIAEFLVGICKATSDHALVSAKDALLSHTLQLYRMRLKEYLGRLRQNFESHKGSYERLVADVFGILDQLPSKKDYELMESLIRFHSVACTTPMEYMKKEGYKEIAFLANELLRLKHFEVRLKPVLGNAFANDLYKGITLLARPQQVVDTMSRAARSLPTTVMVRIHRGPPDRNSTPIARETPVKTNPQAAKAPDASPSSSSPSSSTSYGQDAVQKSNSLIRMPPPGPITPSTRSSGVSSVTTRPETVTSPISTTESGVDSTDIFTQVKAYLLPHERHIGINQLQPTYKKNAYILVASLLSGNNPLPEWDAYYDFGFPACRNEDERQHLGGTYLAILQEGSSKPSALKDLWRALENNELMKLIDAHNYSKIRPTIPDLEVYLTTDPSKRETVWRLVQFVRAEDQTDPPETLLGGYRFGYTKGRDDVEILKDLYANMLDTLHPLQIHEACEKGRLLEAAIQQVKSPIHKEVHRLLRSQSLIPGEAYEGTAKGAVSGSGGKFKNRQKWKETFQYGR